MTGGPDNVSNTNVLRSYIHVFTPQSAKFLSISPKLCQYLYEGKSQMKSQLRMISPIVYEVGYMQPLCLDSYPYLRLFRVMPPMQLLLQTLPVTSVLSWNIDRNVKMLLTTVKSIFVVMPCSVKLVQRSRF